MKFNRIKRTIIIGDVHGCLDELDALITKVNYNPNNDRLYFLGDIINRGPHSKDTFFRVLELGGVSVLGNHEWQVLEWIRKKKDNAGLRKLRREFGSRFESFLNELATWSLFIETKDFILVHAGLIPGCPPSETDARVLTSIRTWDGKGLDLKHPDNPAWFELYEGSKLVVFGHWAVLGKVFKNNTLGLDSGCVYGKELSALILPDFEVVSVKAAKVYHSPDNPA